MDEREKGKEEMEGMAGERRRGGREHERRGDGEENEHEYGRLGD